MGSADKYRELLSSTQSEINRYVALAQAARESGNADLAGRFDEYVSALSDKNVEHFIDWQVSHAWQAVQNLARVDSGNAYVAAGVQGGHISELALSRIRQMLLGPDELKGVEPEQLEDGSTRYSAPMQGGMQYVETHDPDPDGGIDVEIHKSPEV